MITLRASYYQQFDADDDLDVPGEGYGGWREADVEIDLDHTALVLMHAWQTGTREQYPGWYRAVEYIPRAQAIQETVFPLLLDAVRARGVTLFHVVGGGDYYKDYPGYRKAVIRLDGPEVSRLLEMTRGKPVTVLAGLIEENPTGKPFITQIVVRDGQLLGFYRKITIEEEETDWFSPGETVPVFTHDGLTFGIAICADLGNEKVYAECNLTYLRNTSIGNILNLCALTVPCGFTREGLPVGLLIYGKSFQEDVVLRVGYAFQQATDWHQRMPNLGWAKSAAE